VRGKRGASWGREEGEVVAKDAGWGVVQNKRGFIRTKCCCWIFREFRVFRLLTESGS
jgi:hypothetical protein